MVGSFKIRGAYNVLRQLSASELAGGVCTVSAGNAAQGVALAARLVGARATVMVIDQAPDTKVQAIERLGAKKDGVIRGQALRRDGTLRDTVMYSVTAAEWRDGIKAGLEAFVRRRTAS